MDIVLEHADFDLVDKNVMPANVLLLNQADFTELFKVVISDAGAAKMQSPLDFANADRFTVL